MEERPIRNAASVICVRDGARAPEVLVVERGPDAGFLAGYVVFPGGAVDAEDEAHAERWFGDASEAHRAAAVRELLEEVGLVLTAGGLGPSREEPVAAVEAAPPDASQLSEMTRWIAPPEVPVRFDARYFAVMAGDGLEPAPDGEEAVRAWWVSPRTLMAEWADGHHKLYWPTWYTMGELAACPSAAVAFSLRFEAREPTPHEEATLPRSVMEEA